VKHRTRISIKAPKGKSLPYPYRTGDAEALALRVCRLKDASAANATDDEIIAGIERETGRRIHDRDAVLRAIDRLADIVVDASIPPVS
jgi:Flp pilus assembly CpaF family ATPase